MTALIQKTFTLLAASIVLALVLFEPIARLRSDDHGSPPQKPASQKEQKKKSKLPPLIVDTKSPLLLDDPDPKSKGAGPLAPSVAENTACYVCHDNYRRESLALLHGKGEIGCVDCHGKSYAHRNDENNTTPPDIMFPKGEIDDGCAKCHDTHDVSAQEVIARIHQRQIRPSDSRETVCTDCHGEHRLAHRTVQWDRKTGKLLTGTDNAPQTPAGPTLETFTKLAGIWVKATPDGKPTDQIVSTYRVTAAGSAVMELLFPGSDHEMVTIYHQDGNDLILTHYCAAGNQPRMICRYGTTNTNQLVFEFLDGTNMNPSVDRHMHAVTLTIADDNHLEAEWQAYDKGKRVGISRFDLVRKQD